MVTPTSSVAGSVGTNHVNIGMFLMLGQSYRLYDIIGFGYYIFQK